MMIGKNNNEPITAHYKSISPAKTHRSLENSPFKILKFSQIGNEVMTQACVKLCKKLKKKYKKRIKNKSLLNVFLTNVLAGKADHSACHIKRVLTPLQHAAKPIEGRILIGASHGLVQCRDTVEMLLTFGLTAKKSCESK